MQEEPRVNVPARRLEGVHVEARLNVEPVGVANSRAAVDAEEHEAQKVHILDAGGRHDLFLQEHDDGTR